MIKAVTFDFWSTLVKDTGDTGHKRRWWRVEAMQQALVKGGWTGNAGQVDEAIEAVGKYSSAVRLKGGVDYVPEEQLSLLLSKLQVDPSPVIRDEIFEAYTTATAQIPPDPLPGVVEVVKKLSREFPLGLISNTGITPGKVLRQVLAGLGILQCFTTLTFSNEVNLVKPNPGIFTLTAQNLGVRVEDTAHVGDDYEADVLGAQGVGAKGVWLNAQGSEALPAFATIKTMAELPTVLRG